LNSGWRRGVSGERQNKKKEKRKRGSGSRKKKKRVRGGRPASPGVQKKETSRPYLNREEKSDIDGQYARAITKELGKRWKEGGGKEGGPATGRPSASRRGKREAGKKKGGALFHSITKDRKLGHEKKKREKNVRGSHFSGEGQLPRGNKNRIR